MATQHLEDSIYTLLSKTLDDTEIRSLHSWSDIVRHIDEESREDMKEDLLRFVLERINALRIIGQLRINIPPDEEEESHADTEEDEDS